MRIEAPTAEDRREGRRASARIVWEGPRRGPETMWFETDPAFAADLDPAPEAFLLAAMPVAVWTGEPRLRIEGPACARLAEGLEDAMRVYAHWYPGRAPVPIEATGGFRSLRPLPARRAGFFVSGGVDSLSMLRSNRLDYPLDHPASFRDGIYLFGWNTHDFRGPEIVAERRRAFEEQGARLDRLARASRWTVVPVRTNVRTFHPDWEMSRRMGFGAGMIAAAHLFPRRLTEAWFASHGYGASQGAYGSHALVDRLYGSAAVEIGTGEPMRSRPEKLENVSEWDEALRALQVCLMEEVPPPGRANCGRCEKCLRTALGLLALGRLDRAPTFPDRDVTPEMAARYVPSADVQFLYSRALIADLERIGRRDLADVLRECVERTARRDRRRRRWWNRAWRRLRGRPLPPAVP